jgi:hypothetical protein
MQIASVIEEAWDKVAVFIGIHIDMDAIRKLQVSSSHAGDVDGNLQSNSNRVLSSNSRSTI